MCEAGGASAANWVHTGTLATLISLGGVSPPSLAAIFNVNETNDGVDAVPGDGVCQTLFVGQCTLRAAVMEANALEGPDIIVLPGNSTLLLTRQGDDNTGENGDLDITESLLIGTFTVPAEEYPVVDASAMNDRVFDVRAPAKAPFSLEVTFQRFAITRGDALLSQIPYGGAIRLQLAEVTLDRMNLFANRAQRGGAIHNLGSNVTITDSSIHDNGVQAPGSVNAEGSAIYHTGALMVIERTSIYDNQSSGDPAEAIMSNDSFDADPTIMAIFDSTITGNVSLGINSDGETELSLNNVTITGNGTQGIQMGINDGLDTAVLRMKNTIVADHPDLGNCALGVLNEQSVDDFNLVDDFSCGDVSIGASNFIVDDAMLANAQTDAVGWHRIVTPLPDSAAIDNGAPTVGFGGCGETDQTGRLRPLDGDNDGDARCDIGAVEVLIDTLFSDGFE